jgi:hypothetical protein
MVKITLVLLFALLSYSNVFANSCTENELRSYTNSANEACALKDQNQNDSPSLYFNTDGSYNFEAMTPEHRVHIQQTIADCDEKRRMESLCRQSVATSGPILDCNQIANMNDRRTCEEARALRLENERRERDATRPPTPTANTTDASGTPLTDENAIIAAIKSDGTELPTGPLLRERAGFKGLIGLKKSLNDEADNDRAVSRNDKRYGLASLLRFCEWESTEEWPDIAGGSGDWNPSVTQFDASVKQYLGKTFKDVKGQPGAAVASAMKTALENVVSIANEYYATIPSCPALSKVTGRSLNREEADNGDFAGGGNGNTITVQSSINPEFKCISKLRDTQDFPACKKMLNTFDAAHVADAAIKVGQSVYIQSENMGRQTDLQQKQMNGGTIGLEDSLKMQEEAVKDEAGIAYQRAAVDAAKLAALAAMLKGMPTEDTLIKECGSINAHQMISASKTSLDTYLGEVVVALASNGATISVDNGASNLEFKTAEIATDIDPCQTVPLSHKSNVALIQNTRARDFMTKFLVKTGVDAASNLAIGAMLDKRADQIGDLANGVKSFEPPPFDPNAGWGDATSSECLTNPDAAGCLPASGPRGVDYYNSGINIDGGQFATTDGEAILDTSRADPSASDPTSRGGVVNSIGSPIAGVDNPSGLEGNTPGAASIKGADPTAAGGGAGAAGGGGGAQPNNPGARKPASDGSSASNGTASIKFGGSGAGGLNWSSGRNSRKTAKADNPLAGLLGKKSNGEVVDGFRGPASAIGKKSDGLFQMITRRYSVVANEKRLIEYEEKKK